jgi:Zn-dependent protease with chaperone function
LSTAAQDHPAAPSPGPRAALAFMAVLAELSFVGASMLAWAPLILLQAIFLGPTVATVVGIAFILGTWWVVQPPAPPAPVLLHREQAPVLFAALDALRERLDAPPLHGVALVDELNAAARLSGGFLSLVGGRRTLLLGVPLLRLLGPQEALAVIAHELGHFSRHHGRLGHWIYIVRAKWDVYLDSDPAHDSGIDRLRRWIASAFLPRFIRLSMQRSRACEFEADALAARASDATSLVQSLARLELADALMRDGLRTRLHELQAASIHPPAAFWDLVADSLRDEPAARQAAALEAGSRRPARRNDSHPPLAERAGALGEPVAPPSWTDAPCAGESLLGPLWRETFDGANARWAEQIAPAWRLRHLHLAALRAGPDPADTAIDPRQHTLQRLQADDEIAASEQSLAALRQHAQSQPDDAPAQYALGLALLARERPEGIEQVRVAIRLDRRFAVAGYGAILSQLELHGSEAELSEFTRRRALAAEKLESLDTGLWQHLLKEELAAPPPWARALLLEAIAEDRALDACWVLRTERSNDAGQRFTLNIFVARVCHDLMAADEVDEDLLAARYGSYLRTLFPHNEPARVMLRFDTEVFHPPLLERFARLPGCEIRRPTRPINVDVVRIDSL